MDEQVLGEIGTMAQSVAAQAEAQRTVISEERDAEAAVLTRVIENVRPALRALASKIWREWGETGGQNGCNPVSIRVPFDERGLVLVDDFEQERDTTGNRGGLTGERLYLLSNGQLALVMREGEFSHWQGEWDRYEATLSLVSPREAMNKYKLDDCLSAIHKALTGQVNGNREKVTKAAQERATKLRALVELVK